MNYVGNFHRRNVGFGKRSRVAKERGNWNFLEENFLLRLRHALCVCWQILVLFVHEWWALAVTLCHTHCTSIIECANEKKLSKKKKGTSVVVMTHQTRLVWFTLSLIRYASLEDGIAMFLLRFLYISSKSVYAEHIWVEHICFQNGN